MGWTWKMAWLFVWEGIGIGIGREPNTRRKEGIAILYEGVGVGVGVARVNTINLTLPYLTFYTCIFHRLSAGYVPVVVRDYMLQHVLRHKSPSSPPA